MHRAMLTACPSSLAARKTVTPVIQAHEHIMENVCMCLCVFSGDYDSEGGGGGGQRDGGDIRNSSMLGHSHIL